MRGVASVLSTVSILALACTGLTTHSYHPVHVAKPIHHRLPLGGNILPIGIYYTNVEVGTPPKQFAVTIDTGSTDLLIPVAGCDGCKANTSVYDPAASTSSAIEGCNKTLSCSKCVVSFALAR